MVYNLKKIIYTPRAPKPIGPYSQAICINGWLFISGQIPIDPITGNLVEGDLKVKTKRVLDNIKAILEDAGGSLGNVVKVTVYFKNLSMFSEFNEIYSEYFKEEPPARSVVEVSNLPRGSDIELDIVAYIGTCK